MKLSKETNYNKRFRLTSLGPYSLSARAKLSEFQRRKIFTTEARRRGEEQYG